MANRAAACSACNSTKKNPRRFRDAGFFSNVENQTPVFSGAKVAAAAAGRAGSAGFAASGAAGAGAAGATGAAGRGADVSAFFTTSPSGLSE